MQDAPATGIIWARWGDIVGPQVAQHAEPTSLKNGVLRVRTDSPTWATEIGYLGSEIAASANREAGRKMVDRVVVWTGPRPAGAPSVPASSGQAPEAESPPQLRSASSDPMEAFEAAKRAWLRRRGRGPS